MPYIFLRIDEQGVASAVHSANTIKDAKYWLSYIAQPGDALFQTPKHPKYKGIGTPTYYAHLVKRGVLAYDENQWHLQVQKDGSQIKFPDDLTPAP